MSRLHQLPRLPNAATRTLTDEQARWLDRRYPAMPKPPKCVTCQGKRQFRWYVDPAHTEVGEFECRCADEQYPLHRLLTFSGVGKDYQRLGWNDVHRAPVEAVALVHEYAENAEDMVEAGVGLIFHGDRGTAKTMLLSLLFKELVCLHEMDGYSITHAAMLEAFSAGWTSPEERVWFERRIRHASILFVDDVGREHKGANSISSSTLEDIIRHRTQGSLPTFVTTELSLDEFAAGYGGSVMQVLLQKSLPREFVGPSWRTDANERMKRELVIDRVRRPIVVS